MSRNTALCAHCHADLLHHKAGGSLTPVLDHVAELKIDPNANAGAITLLITCRCGEQLPWVVRAGRKRIGPVEPEQSAA